MLQGEAGPSTEPLEEQSRRRSSRLSGRAQPSYGEMLASPAGGDEEEEEHEEGSPTSAELQPKKRSRMKSCFPFEIDYDLPKSLSKQMYQKCRSFGEGLAHLTRNVANAPVNLLRVPFFILLLSLSKTVVLAGCLSIFSFTFAVVVSQTPKQVEQHRRVRARGPSLRRGGAGSGARTLQSPRRRSASATDGRSALSGSAKRHLIYSSIIHQAIVEYFADVQF